MQKKFRRRSGSRSEILLFLFDSYTNMHKEDWIAVTLFITILIMSPIIYFIVKQIFSQKKEGFMNPSDPNFNITLYGATSNASTYLNDMNKYHNDLLNSICGTDINKYISTYEDIIQTLDDILGLTVLQITLSIDVKSMTQQQIVEQMTKITDLVEAQLILSYHVYNYLDNLKNEPKKINKN